MVCLLQVENYTSNCTQLYFVESIRKNFVLTDGTGSFCNGGLHSLFASCSGLRWLDIVFQGKYLPSLSVSYVAISKDLEKLTPQLY